MIRTLLATTAVAAVLALPVIAQDSSMSSMESSVMDSSISSEASSEAPVDTSSAVSSEAPMDAPSAMPTEPAPPFEIVTVYTHI